MSSVYAPYVSMVVMFVLVGGLVGTILLLNALLGPKRLSAVKSAPFECGSDPIGSARQRLSVRFYLTAIVFIAFDIEAVFLYPWAVLLRSYLRDPRMAGLALGEMVVFIAILAAGLVYVWRRGALDWGLKEEAESP